MAKRLSAEKRRESIINVAKKLFANKGYHGVSIDEIVAAVGVSPAVLYKHFSSKEQLYDAVLFAHATNREDFIAAVLDTDGSFKDVLRAMTRIYVASIAWQPDRLKMELHSLLEGTASSNEFIDNQWKTFSDYIIGELQEKIANGEIKPLNTKIAALMFQGMVREILISQALDTQDRFPDLYIDEMVDELLTLFFAACGLNNTF